MFRTPAYEARNAYKSRKWPEYTNKHLIRTTVTNVGQDKRTMKDIKKDVKSLEKNFSKMTNSDMITNIIIPTGEMMHVITEPTNIALSD